MVRLADERDARAVGELLHRFQVESDEFTPGADVLAERVPAAIARGDSAFLLAGEPPAGFAELRLRHSLLSGELDAYLEELYVVPERRGEGLGRALLRHAIDVARERGASHIDLTTSEGDTAALGLYEAEGFTNLEGEHRMLYYERDL